MQPTNGSIKVKRAYEPPARDDGVRVLVDRLWPRGLSRTKASIDLWLKDLAPSVALRRWFKEQPEKWTEFRRRYSAELDANRAAIAALLGASRTGRVTLLYGAREQRRNHAVALQEYLHNRTWSPA